MNREKNFLQHTLSGKQNAKQFPVVPVSYIGKPSARNRTLEEIEIDDIVTEFTLHQFLESFAVFDPAVSHYVEPIRMSPDGEQVAERCMILIDFSQTRQDI